MVFGLVCLVEVVWFFSFGVFVELIDIGFLKYLLLCFLFKMGVWIEVVLVDMLVDVVLLFDGVGMFVFDGFGIIWIFVVISDGDEVVGWFVDWIIGDVGCWIIDIFLEKDGI